MSQPHESDESGEDAQPPLTDDVFDDLVGAHGEGGEPEDPIRAAKEVLRELRRERRRRNIEALPYPLGEEIANAITHGLGWLFSVGALVSLLWVAIGYHDPWKISSAIVYGTSLILLYCASTLYHALTAPRAKRVFGILDHSAIYLLIAGSYTPFALVLLRDRGGWWLFYVVWALAIIGVAAEAFWRPRPAWAPALVYIGMGWLAVLMIGPIRETLDPMGVWLLVAGGLAYTGGTIFYVLKKVPYMHSVWHLFVLAGSTLHYLSVIGYVFPTR